MGTLGSLALYLGVIIAGVFIGSRKAVKKHKLKWLSVVQTIALILMIFMLGVEIGADDRVIASLGTIGLSALFITLLALAGSVLAVLLVRKLFRLDKKGMTKKQREEILEMNGGSKNV